MKHLLKIGDKKGIYKSCTRTIARTGQKILRIEKIKKLLEKP